MRMQRAKESLGSFANGGNCTPSRTRGTTPPWWMVFAVTIAAPFMGTSGLLTVAPAWANTGLARSTDFAGFVTVAFCICEAHESRHTLCSVLKKWAAFPPYIMNLDILPGDERGW